MHQLNQCTFEAKYLDITKEENLYIFGIADDAEDPRRYVVIQYSQHDDEQEISLGHDKEYFDSSFIDKGCYGVVKKIIFQKNNILIYIKDKDGDSKNIVVDIKKCTKSSDEIYEMLKKIHKDTMSKILLERL